MITAERIQALVHKLEVGGARRLNYLALVVAVLGLVVLYDLFCYRNFATPEAMDAAQVARNLAEGNGFTTEYIRPFSVYLMQKHNHALAPDKASLTNATDYAQLKGRHPDLANAPLYPLLLAGLWKIHMPDWKVPVNKNFWTKDGKFMRYPPEFFLAFFNQLLLLVVVWLTFLITKKIFDAPAAWLAALLVLGSDLLWKFSVSGLPTLLLLVIFLGLVWCLASFETLGDGENPEQRPRFILAVSIGLLVGLGMLTRYSFGWVIFPVIFYFGLFGGARRTGLAVTVSLVFAVTVAPWIVRNLAVSGTFFGTAGYAIVESTINFPGTRLMQSVNPDMAAAYWMKAYLVKLWGNLRALMQNEILHLGGGWMGILFLAGLLLGLRNTAARRLRYFTMMCLGVFLVVAALGRTQLTIIAPDMNTENPLVLLTPMVVIFGVAFFLTLLNQMNAPSVQVRYGVVAFVVLLACQQFIMTLLPPRNSPIAYPPYYPPEVQKFSAWMRPDELVMSDIPWAVAWYGDRQSVLLTINSQYEFFQFNDNAKLVNAIYLTLDTINARLITDCFQGGIDSWGSFVFERIAPEKIVGRNSAADTWGSVDFKMSASRQGSREFPLKFAPSGFYSGLFLTDHQRWQTE